MHHYYFGSMGPNVLYIVFIVAFRSWQQDFSRATWYISYDSFVRMFSFPTFWLPVVFYCYKNINCTLRETGNAIRVILVSSWNCCNGHIFFHLFLLLTWKWPYFLINKRKSSWLKSIWFLSAWSFFQRTFNNLWNNIE